MSVQVDTRGRCGTGEGAVGRRRGRLGTDANGQGDPSLRRLQTGSDLRFAEGEGAQVEPQERATGSV